ncbi:uncharacterized protein MELLADRAFT_69872 [Melampsora larici-populina 98AG31]|uniref:Uncharacterized protein n=1 Tax=Melampsora larici-populina (strain 98AG31 / pathotype 3-4-7) TaxID=747676 RepID=F4SCL2_MELLP|nr:uncharacterized protein MELLADRAFT_69872 [Melampsora larici-populina 98AG31]EGF97617.1 hypothetical protein MELLADRAFT_69872 [Melampsora larici-populina 98AG31]
MSTNDGKDHIGDTLSKKILSRGIDMHATGKDIATHLSQPATGFFSNGAPRVGLGILKLCHILAYQAGSGRLSFPRCHINVLNSLSVVHPKCWDLNTYLEIWTPADMHEVIPQPATAHDPAELALGHHADLELSPGNQAAPDMSLVMDPKNVTPELVQTPDPCEDLRGIVLCKDAVNSGANPCRIKALYYICNVQADTDEAMYKHTTCPCNQLITGSDSLLSPTEPSLSHMLDYLVNLRDSDKLVEAIKNQESTLLQNSNTNKHKATSRFDYFSSTSQRGCSIYQWPK